MTETQYKCDLCGIYFTRKYSYECHLKSTKHTKLVNGDVSFDCQCGCQYFHKNSFYRHKRLCTFVAPNTTESDETTEEYVNDNVVENIPTTSIEDELRNEISTLKQNISHVKELCESLKNELFESLKKELFESLKKELLKENSHLQSTKKSTRVKISDSIRQRIAQDQSRQCKQCNTPLTSVFQIDHKTALRFGGTNDPSNLQALCTECHVNKSRVESKYQQKINEFIESTIRDGLQELSNLQQK